MKFLVIQTAFIGDVVLATPLVEKLHRFYPGASIDFLLRQGNEKLLEGHPIIRQVLIWEKRQRKYGSLLDLIRRVRLEQYDWVINCQRFAAAGLLTVFSGAHHSVGFDKNPLSAFFSRRISHLIGNGQHEVSRNLELIQHLTDASFERPRLYPSSKDAEKARQLADGQPYVCIAPTSVWFTKQFPAHQWIALIHRLPADCRIMLLGGPGDYAACEQIRLETHRPTVLNLAGKLSFLESAALMAGAQLNYVNDSAPLHIASAVNAPVAAVFCSTVPAFGFTPLSDQSHLVETTLKLDCRPCGLHGYRACPKGHFACAESISVEAFPLP